MEGMEEFRDQLGTALEQKRSELEERDLPKLKEEYRLFHAAFQGIYELFKKWGILEEDPYKNDERISEISPPSSEHMLESERDQQMGIRLGQYDNQLDFLNNYTQFNLDSLTLKRLKNIIALTNYIKWPQLTPNSTNPPTRVMAEYIQKLKSEGDKMSANVVQDSQEQLNQRTRTILQLLKQISLFKKYQYKHQVLESVAPHAQLDPNGSVQENQKRLKRAFNTAQTEIPFYSDLVQELLEELSDEQKREEALSSLAVQQTEKPQKAGERSLKPILMEALRALAGASRPLESANTKLQENVTVLESRRRGLMQRLRDFVDRLYNRTPQGRVFEVEYLDENTSTAHTEQLDFDSLSERTLKKARTCGAILSKVSSLSRKLEAASEEQLFEYLNKQLSEVFVLRRQIESLDTYLQTEVPREQRSRLRGLNVEIQQLKEAIGKANQKKHQYVAEKDEQEQFRKLGIEPE
jgi:hypothetical protein